jgi:hypothetical protein
MKDERKPTLRVKRWGREARGRNDPNNVCTCE